MKVCHLFTHVSLALTVLLSPLPQARCADISGEFTLQAENSLSRGDLNRALELYARAYILQPENQGILEKILELNSSEHLAAGRRLQLEEIHSYAMQLDRLKEAVWHYSQKKDELVGRLTRQGADIELINLEMALIQKKAQQEHDTLLEKAKGLFDGTTDPLGLALALLKQNHLSLDFHLGLLQKQMDRLKVIMHQEAPVDYQRLTGYDVAFMKKKHQLFFARFEAGSGRSQPRYNTNADADISELTRQLRETQFQLEDQNKQISALEDSLAVIQQRDSFREHLLEEKNQQITVLNGNIVDLQSQLMLRKRIVQEKEENLERVKEKRTDAVLELIEDNQRFQKTIQRQNKELRQLEAILAVYQQRFSQNNNDILTNQYAGRLDNESAALSLLDSKDKKITEKEGQILELKNIIEIYKVLLSKAKEEQRGASAQLSGYKESYNALHNALTKQNQTILDAEYKLMTMKKELTNVQTRLLAFRSLPGTKGYAREQDELLAIEDELKNIHSFLLNQLDDFEKLNNDFIAGDVHDFDRVLRLDLERIENR